MARGATFMGVLAAAAAALLVAAAPAAAFEQIRDEDPRAVRSATCDPVCQTVRELLPLQGIPRAFPYYADPGRRLGQANSNITIGVIMYHGTNRNADEYFCYMQNSVRQYFGSARASEVLVIAPAVRIPSDRPSSDELFWDDNDGWKMGSESTATLSARISSFAVLDEMLTVFADRALYPNLKAIVVAGHSAGGQVLQRYALGTPLHDAIVGRGIDLRLLPANPSSFVYLDPERPVLGTRDCATFCANGSIADREFTFQVPAEDCSGKYNEYRYGLEKLNNYMSQLGAEAMLQEYPKRNVFYVQGLADNCNESFGCGCQDNGLDTSCGATLQGYCRLWRGYAFWQHVQKVYARRGVPGPIHEVVAVNNIGHDGCSIFQSPEAKAAMFTGL